MLKHLLSDVLAKGVRSHGSSGGSLCMLMFTSTYSSQPRSAPRSFFGVTDYMDDDNSRPYNHLSVKRPKNLDKRKTFNQRTEAFLQPFILDLFVKKSSVRATITHRVTTKQVAVAGTKSKDLKAALPSRSDIRACQAVGRFLADRAREADVYSVRFTPREGREFQGNIRAVVQSLIDNGIDVKVYLD